MLNVPERMDILETIDEAILSFRQKVMMSRPLQADLRPRFLLLPSVRLLPHRSPGLSFYDEYHMRRPLILKWPLFQWCMMTAIVSH